jgi:hypothetical protein
MGSVKVDMTVEYKGVAFSVKGEYGTSEARCDTGWLACDIGVQGVSLLPVLSHPTIRAILGRAANSLCCNGLGVF